MDQICFEIFFGIYAFKNIVSKNIFDIKRWYILLSKPEVTTIHEITVEL